jgi:hypothetical protein
MVNQKTNQGETNSHMRQILLQQYDAVVEIVNVSQKLLDQPRPDNVAHFEDLLSYRSEQVRIIEKLEAERLQLMGPDQEMDKSMQPIQEEIQEALGLLALLDNRLQEMVFSAQLRITNNLAFGPKFVNLGRNAAHVHHSASRVVDITR